MLCRLTQSSQRALEAEQNCVVNQSVRVGVSKWQEASFQAFELGRPGHTSCFLSTQSQQPGHDAGGGVNAQARLRAGT